MTRSGLLLMIVLGVPACGGGEGASGSEAGGTSGGTSSGGTSSGVNSGGTNSGGANSGGANSGGTSSGGTSSGGTSSGGAGGHRGSTACSVPWVEEDFSGYSSTAEMLADPGGIYVLSDEVGTQHMTLDTTDGVAGSTQSLRYDFPAWNNCQNHSIKRAVRLPPAPTKEIWLEVDAKYQSGFVTGNPGCAGGQFAHKFLLARMDQGRFEIINGVFGTQWKVAYPGDAPNMNQFLNVPSGFGTGHDGQWHNYRLHMKISASMSSGDGIIDAWFDGQKKVSDTSINVYYAQGSAQPVSPSKWAALDLGATLNSGPPQPQTLHFGRIRVYTSDPCW